MRLQRKKVIALIARELRRDPEIADDVLSTGLGWSSNSVERDFGSVARAAIVLLPLASVDELEHAANMAVYYGAIAKGATGHDAIEIARARTKALGVRYGACGCLSVEPGTRCCDDDVNERAEREVQVVNKLHALAETNPKKFDEMLELLGRLVAESEKETRHVAA